MRVPAVLVVALALAAPAVHAQEGADEFALEDFEGDTLGKWQYSVSPEYYKVGEGRKGLEFIEDRLYRHRLADVDINLAEVLPQRLESADQSDQ